MENTGNEENTMSGYNLTKARQILQVDAKTFARWLQKAEIEPQINPADPREKLLTTEQILQLGQGHGRTVHFPAAEQPKGEQAPLTPATLGKELSELKQVFTRRLDRQEEIFRTLIGDLQRDLAQTTPSPRVQSLAAPKPAPSSPVPTRVSTRKRTKKAVSSKRLPRTLIPLHIFRSMHGVSQKAAEYAVETGKLPVVRGKWLYQNRYTTAALDEQGRQQFYALFHERDAFQHCKECPHVEQVIKQS